MLTRILRAAADRLSRFHARFARLFGRSEAQEHSRTYLQGLLLAEGRKSVEPIALRFVQPKNNRPVSQNEVLALQGFLTDSPWEASAVQKEIQAVFAEELLPSTTGSVLGSVGVIDESGFEKSGPHSVGAKRQYCGRLGKTENCQVGVFLVGSTPAGDALLDHQLYLPQEWASDAKRRQKARVPKEIRFQTKPAIASELIRRTEANGHVRFNWIVADEHYGENGTFLDRLEEQGKRYMVEVSSSTTFWTVDPATQVPAGSSGAGRPPSRPSREHVASAAELAAGLPVEAWQPIKLREGENGPLVYEYACRRLWAVRHRKPGPAIWLVLQRSPDNPAEIKYWVSNADEATPLETLALAGAVRLRVEIFLEEAKGELGMADYEARAWTSWHHHMSLVALAHLYATQVRNDTRATEPRMTLRQGFDLLKAALIRPQLSLEEALHLTEYHLTRNGIAKRSHRKTWLTKHKELKQKLLL